jgi:hypothetical protein
MEQYVHAGEVDGGDVVLLPMDFVDPTGACALVDIEQQQPEPQAKSSMLQP